MAGTRAEVTQSEHEMLRGERMADRGATQQSRQSAVCEAAEVLRLSARTVREYAKRGEIRGKSLENGGHYDVQASRLYEALARVRKRRRVVELDAIVESEKEGMQSLHSRLPSHEASNSEIRRLLEQEVDALPDNYRAIFVLRDVGGIDVAEVAEILDISSENVKTRLHRAHALLRKRLYLGTGAQSHEAFLFHATRCDRVVQVVFARLGLRQQAIRT